MQTAPTPPWLLSNQHQRVALWCWSESSREARCTAPVGAEGPCGMRLQVGEQQPVAEVGGRGCLLEVREERIRHSPLEGEEEEAARRIQEPRRLPRRHALNPIRVPAANQGARHTTDGLQCIRVYQPLYHTLAMSSHTNRQAASSNSHWLLGKPAREGSGAQSIRRRGQGSQGCTGYA